MSFCILSHLEPPPAGDLAWDRPAAKVFLKAQKQEWTGGKRPSIDWCTVFYSARPGTPAEVDLDCSRSMSMAGTLRAFTLGAPPPFRLLHWQVRDHDCRMNTCAVVARLSPTRRLERW